MCNCIFREKLSRQFLFNANQLFWSHFKTDGDTNDVADRSKRGRGSDSVDNASLYEVRPNRIAAISAFIKFANSSQGAAKVSPSPPSQSNCSPCPVINSKARTSYQVTLDEIAKYMEFGPDDGSSAPPLPEALRVKIPRSSLRYLLIHHLEQRYRYTTKKPTFSDPVKRHNRIRKFIIEMDRALQL